MRLMYSARSVMRSPTSASRRISTSRAARARTTRSLTCLASGSGMGFLRATGGPVQTRAALPLTRNGTGRRVASGRRVAQSPSPRSASGRRADVLVDPEQVARVVRRLDLREQVVVLAVDRPDAVLALVHL